MTQDTSCPAAPEAAELPVTVIRPSRGWVPLELGDLIAYRELLGFLAWRDIKVRYKQTVLGAAWAIIQPFAAMVVFTIFFHRMAGIGPESDVPYPIWSYAGLLPWTLFAQAFTRASQSLVAESNLLTKVYFPRLIMPLAATLSAVADFAIAFLVFAGMLLYYGITPGIEMLYLPLLLLLALMTATGVGLWLAAINVKYRDVRYTIPFIVQMWLFTSPVVYPSSKVPEAYRMIYGLNPMAGVIDGFRWCLLGVGSGPGPMFWVSVGVSAFILITGAFYFRRMEDSFADIV
jgi:lipopolysaccharide transport system permease protein